MKYMVDSDEKFIDIFGFMLIAIGICILFSSWLFRLINTFKEPYTFASGALIIIVGLILVLFSVSTRNSSDEREKDRKHELKKLWIEKSSSKEEISPEMIVNKENQLKFKVYLEQYKQCFENWRHLNSLEWEIPTVTFTIDATLVGLAYQYLQIPSYVKGIVLIISALFTLLMLIAMTKHRLGLDNSINYRRYLAKEMFGLNEDMPMITRDVLKFLERDINWVKMKDPLYKKFIHRSAYHWSQWAMLFTFIGLILLAISTILTG